MEPEKPKHKTDIKTNRHWFVLNTIRWCFQNYLQRKKTNPVGARTQWNHAKMLVPIYRELMSEMRLALNFRTLSRRMPPETVLADADGAVVHRGEITETTVELLDMPDALPIKIYSPGLTPLNTDEIRALLLPEICGALTGALKLNGGLSISTIDGAAVSTKHGK